MRLSFLSPSGLVLAPALLLALQLSQVAAQLTDLPNLTDAATNTATNNNGGQTTTGRNTQTAATTGRTTAATTRATTQAQGTNQGTTQQTSGGSMTTTAPTTAITNAPTLSTGTVPVVGGLSDLPTIAGVGIPTMIVPWTAGAPFMQKSSLPEGTVFICVGAILGFLGAAVLLWRGLVAWSLHRSVQRTAYFSQQKNEKATLHKPRPNRVSRAASFGAGHPNSMSMDHLPKPFAGSRPASYVDGHKPPNPRDSNLFFSPTAGAGVHAHAHGGPDRRPGSSYMPAGFYASSSVHVPSTTQLNAPHSSHSHLPSLATRPASSSAGYQRPSSYAPSPPATPPHRAADIYPRTANSSVVGGVGSAIDSASTLNLNAPGGNAAGGRAPSAYLEDMFDHSNGPRERY